MAVNDLGLLYSNSLIFSKVWHECKIWSDLRNRVWLSFVSGWNLQTYTPLLALLTFLFNSPLHFTVIWTPGPSTRTRLPAVDLPRLSIRNQLPLFKTCLFSSMLEPIIYTDLMPHLPSSMLSSREMTLTFPVSILMTHLASVIAHLYHVELISDS